MFGLLPKDISKFASLKFLRFHPCKQFSSRERESERDIKAKDALLIRFSWSFCSLKPSPRCTIHHIKPKSKIYSLYIYTASRNWDLQLKSIKTEKGGSMNKDNIILYAKCFKDITVFALFLRGMDSSFQTLALRSSIIIGLITAVATILYFTPLPGKLRFFFSLINLSDIFYYQLTSLSFKSRKSKTLLTSSIKIR